MTKQQEQQPKKNEIWEWTKSIGLALILVWFAKAFVFSAIIVDGVSMEPTLQSGDRMFVNKIKYKLMEPKQQEIIVFHSPDGTDFVKRIIGLPGDRIRYEKDILYVNEQPVEEPYLQALKNDLPIEGLTEDFDLEDLLQVSQVPEGHLFVLGDNRRLSRDSRSIGFVPIEEVVGTTSFTFWPLANIGLKK